MDNLEEFLFDEFIDKYIEENKQFSKGQIVYYEYSYKYLNQTKIGITIGIITNVSVTKAVRKIGNQEYIEYPIVYTVSHPKGVTYNVYASKLGSVSAHILAERQKNMAKANNIEQHAK